MKTIEQIDKELVQAKKDYEIALDNEKTGNKEKGLISKLKQVRLYLEHNPDKSYLEKTVKRLENKVDLIVSSFQYDENKTEDSNDFRRKEHYKIHGLSDIKRQLKNLYFILH